MFTPLPVVLGIVLLLLHEISHLIYKRPWEAISIITPTLEMRKLSQERFKCLIQAFMARQRQSQDLNPGCLYLEPLNYGDSQSALFCVSLCHFSISLCQEVSPYSWTEFK